MGTLSLNMLYQPTCKGCCIAWTPLQNCFLHMTVFLIQQPSQKITCPKVSQLVIHLKMLNVITL